MACPSRLLVVLGAAAFAQACSGERSQDFASQELSRLIEGGEDDTCSGGGPSARYVEGVDENKNGRLDDDEIDEDKSRVVCIGETVPGNGGRLTRTENLPTGDEHCPEGGLGIYSGIDDNDDAELQDREIDDRQYLCGADLPQHAVLTKSTRLPVGHSDCPFGGQRLEIGLDDGAGDATADDDKLGASEVDDTRNLCNSSLPDPTDDSTPPEGEPGKASIDLRGGASAGTGAGGGGVVRTEPADVDQPPCTAEVNKFFPTGTVDASFEIPQVDIALGDVPFRVTKNTTLAYFPQAPVAGAYYYLGGPDFFGIVHITSLGATEFVTGLRIAEGVTLALPSGYGDLDFANDVEILGTLAISGGEAVSMALSASDIVVGSEGAITIPQTGSPSGNVTISGDRVVLAGELLANGVSSGIDGATVEVSARGRVYLAGTIDVSGADSAGTAGNGGIFRALAGTGGVWSSAKIDATGGDGSVTGGAGGEIRLGPSADLSAFRVLDLRNTGRLDASGGSQNGCPPDTECEGGDGGSVILHASAAPLLSSGPLVSDGGEADVFAADAGSIALRVLPFEGTAPEGMRLAASGNLFARGGKANSVTGNSGFGGSLVFRNCTGQGSSSEFLGYKSISLQGGAADASEGEGGQGGSFQFIASDGVSEARRLYMYVPIVGHGGAGTYGGGGGFIYVELSTSSDAVTFPDALPALVMQGDFDLTGGASSGSTGGGGGSASLVALGSIELAGSIDTTAGTGESQGSPFTGAIVAISTRGAVRNQANLSADGGDNPGFTGGGGSCIALEGRTVDNDGLLSAAGGSGGGGTGGDGGYVTIISHDAPATGDGTWDVSGGAGTPEGAPGEAGYDLPLCLR